MGLGLLILLRPWPALLVLACVWKLATESLFIAAGAPVWEFIERGGSYAAPLGLLWIELERRRFVVASPAASYHPKPGR
jgi:hypothetical protein